jgi:hypothetical protein
MKWQDFTPPPLFLIPTTVLEDSSKNLNLVLLKESTPVKDVDNTVDKTTIPLQH